MPNPSELTNADEKLAKARAKRDELADRADRLKAAWLDAQESYYAAHKRYEAAPAAVEKAQNDLTAALREGRDVKALQAKVAGARADVDSLRALMIEAKNLMGERREISEGPARALGQADNELEQAEMNHLTFEIAAAAHRIRPQCARYRLLAQKRGIGLNDSGLLIDGSRPVIGPYQLLPDGSLALIHMARIA